MEAEIATTVEAAAKSRNPIVIVGAVTTALVIGGVTFWRRRKNRGEVVYINAPEQ